MQRARQQLVGHQHELPSKIVKMKCYDCERVLEVFMSTTRVGLWRGRGLESSKTRPLGLCQPPRVTEAAWKAARALRAWPYACHRDCGREWVLFEKDLSEQCESATSGTFYV